MPFPLDNLQKSTETAALPHFFSPACRSNSTIYKKSTEIAALPPFFSPACRSNSTIYKKSTETAHSRLFLSPLAVPTRRFTKTNGNCRTNFPFPNRRHAQTAFTIKRRSDFLHLLGKEVFSSKSLAQFFNRLFFDSADVRTGYL